MRRCEDNVDMDLECARFENVERIDLVQNRV
jgi:hypothetical protein